MAAGDSSRFSTSRFHPSLVRTLHLLLLMVLVLAALSTWLAMPLLNGIADKARQTRTVELPELTRWRHDAQRVELLHGYINTLYWIEDPLEARRTRLQAQVLVHGFGFPAQSKLDQTARLVLAQIKDLTEQRQRQRQALQRIQALSIEHDRSASTTPSRLEAQIDLFSASVRQLSPLGHDWPHLLLAAEQLLMSVERAVPEQPQLALHADHLRRLYAELQQVALLEQQVQSSLAQALAQQNRLAELLHSSAALRTQQLANAMEADAKQVEHYTWALLTTVTLITCALLLAFNYLVLRPIRRINDALRRFSRGAKGNIELPSTLFNELNVINRNVTEYAELTRQLQRANAELKQLSQLDGLTGLANRRRFDQVLSTEHDRARRHGHSLTLVLLDIDHFKQLNDSHGHLFGDDCLRHFADILKRFSQRAGDLSARYGGEEFALILPELGLEQSQALAERIRQQTAEHVQLTTRGEAVRFTLSAGVLYLGDARRLTTADMLAQVDQALYRAKSAGRNRVELTAIHSRPPQAAHSGRA